MAFAVPAFLLLSDKNLGDVRNCDIIKHLYDGINKGARHLLTSYRELKVRKLVETRDTERGAL